MTLYVQSYPARRMVRRWSEQDHSLAVNLREEEAAYVLSALVPGLSAEDLDIQVLEDVVRIQGQYPSDDSVFLMRELPQGGFQRTLRLPVNLQADKVDAKITDGVLELRLPKAESALPKKIKIVSK